MHLHKKSFMYKLLVDKLFDKCQKIQVENERCVMRVNGLKKILRSRTYDVELLKKRLDKHSDNWRSVPMVAPHPKGKTEQKRGPKPKKKPSTTVPNEAESTTSSVTRKPRKQRVKKQTTEAIHTVPTTVTPQQSAAVSN